MMKKPNKELERAKTVYMPESVHDQVQALGFKAGKGISPMVVVLLREAIAARSMPKGKKPATD